MTGAQLEKVIEQKKVTGRPGELYVRRFQVNSGIWFSVGFYVGKVHTVRVEMEEVETVLSLRINDMFYTRTYKRSFSERGLKRICSLFIEGCGNLYSY